MSNYFLEQLEDKIDNAIEIIEILRLQVEELEEKNHALQQDNASLKNRQTEWERSLSALLGKLDGASLGSDKFENRTVERFEEEEIEEIDAVS